MRLVCLFFHGTDPSLALSQPGRMNLYCPGHPGPPAPPAATHGSQGTSQENFKKCSGTISFSPELKVVKLWLSAVCLAPGYSHA